MKPVPISSGGQIAIPAAIRRRWGTRRVRLIDRGSELVIQPIPDDPIAVAAGSLAAYRLPGTDEIRAQLRDEERAREAARYGAE
jgi:bifunctional DNA-binding transcriptional regulator/antitoxin component of YhaV-PrlF toxin-antitoxin module